MAIVDLDRDTIREGLAMVRSSSSMCVSRTNSRWGISLISLLMPLSTFDPSEIRRRKGRELSFSVQPACARATP